MNEPKSEIRAALERVAFDSLLNALERYIAIVPPRCTDGDAAWHDAKAAIRKARVVKGNR